MIIDVNNNRKLNISRTCGGVEVRTFNDNGKIEDHAFFDDGEIVMALNLLRYMKQNGMKSAFLFADGMQKYFQGNIDIGNIEEFRIFQ